MDKTTFLRWNQLAYLSTFRPIMIILIFSIGNFISVNAQSFKDLKTHKTLKLKAQGSFYVGGEKVSQTFEELGSFGPGSTIMVNQMYVKYMIPKKVKKLPVIMIHGMALTGKTWETTPDGRMGWEEYFVRKGYPSYTVDQVARGRSGFNQAIFNNVRTKKVDAAETPMARRFADEFVWPNFRVGEKMNEPFADTQFPVSHLDEFAKQGIPDLTGILPDFSPNYGPLAELSSNLGKAILISHSQSGVFPIEVALINPESVRAIISLEPGYVRVDLDEEKIKLLAKIPTFFIFGDYLELPTGIAHSWQNAYEESLKYAETINNAGGNVKVLRLQDIGMKGNSHMLMQDLNNLDIADMVMDWLKSKELK